MTYLPDNRDDSYYHYKVWNHGFDDALTYEACDTKPYEDDKALKTEYLNGYAQGMDLTTKWHGGVAPDIYRI